MLQWLWHLVYGCNGCRAFIHHRERGFSLTCVVCGKMTWHQHPPKDA